MIGTDVVLRSRAARDRVDAARLRRCKPVKPEAPIPRDVRDAIADELIEAEKLVRVCRARGIPLTVNPDGKIGVDTIGMPHSLVLALAKHAPAVKVILKEQSDPDRRGKKIDAAMHEWMASGELQVLCDLPAFVNDQLREAGYALLTGDEFESLAELTKQPKNIDAPIQVASTGRSEVPTIAGAEWDSTSALQTLCCRDAYIADSLRQAGLSVRSCAGVTAGRAATEMARTETAIVAGKQWDEDPQLQCICGRAAFVNGELESAGLRRMF